MTRTLLAALAAALAAAAAAAPPALAYGPATHLALGRQAVPQVASDPRHAFLATDEGLRNCFLYGTVFPDVQNVPEAVPAFQRFKREVERTPFVRSVRLSADGVQPLGMGTHDRAFLLFLVDRAERSGSQAFLAFALGNLAHVGEDIHAQVMIVPHYMARTGAADVGVRAVADPATAASFTPGQEAEGIVEGMLDYVRPAAEVTFLRDVVRRLHTTGSSYQRLTRTLQREVEIKHLYYLAAKEWHDVRLGRSGFLGEPGFMNMTRLFDAGFTFYAYALGKESAAAAARVFRDRYLDLPWWASFLDRVADAVIRLFTNGRSGLMEVVVAVFNPSDRVSAALRQADPAAEALFAFIQGGESERRVRAKYAQNAEFQRLLASGLLSPATYTTPLDAGAAIVADLVNGRARSRFADGALWAVWDDHVMQAGGIGGLARLAGGAYAAEPALLVSSVRFLDPASGAEVRTLRYPNDVGRALRVEVELFAPVTDPAAVASGGRYVGLTVRSDAGLGAADPVAARGGRSVGIAELAPAAYGSVPRPRLALDFTAPPDTGQAGLHLEADAGRGVFFTTNLAVFAPLTAGRPHYDRFYVAYGAYPPAVRITR